jgi:L-fuculose-phosphate aldolase
MYVTDHGGNLAWKLDDNLLLITPTMINKGDIRSEDLIFANISGQIVEGKRRLTSEFPLYLTFFKERPDINAIIHSHPPYANSFAIAAGKNWLLRPLFAEAILEIGPVPVVPYAEPGSEKLADQFRPYLKKYNSFLMENHGLLTMAREGIEKAMMLVELLEMTSISVLNALKLGNIKEISKEELINLENLIAKCNIALPGIQGENTSLAELYC